MDRAGAAPARVPEWGRRLLVAMVGLVLGACTFEPPPATGPALTFPPKQAWDGLSTFGG